MTAEIQLLRLMLVDDHAIVRQGVRSILEREPLFAVVGEAENGHAALSQLAERPVDLILMDIAMPELDGIETTALIRARSPSTRVVMLTMRSGNDYVRRALEAGASGYCTKDCSQLELFAALEAAARGETHRPASVSPARLIIENANRTAVSQLTPRQAQVIELIALGYTSKEIARHLTISIKTVESHRTALMRQLSIHSVAGLVRYAIRIGMVAPDDERARTERAAFPPTEQIEVVA